MRAPTVIGAVIDLRNCLDLTTREDLELVRTSYHAFVLAQEKAGLPCPRTGAREGSLSTIHLLRYLDCAVIRHLHNMMDLQASIGLAPYDTVRGMFTEGGRLYPGGGFHERTHVQIAVRKPECIRGFFRPRPYPTL